MLFTPEEHQKILKNTIIKILLFGCVFIGGIVIAAIGTKYKLEILGWIGFVFIGLGAILVVLVPNLLFVRYGYKNKIYLQYKRHKNEWEEKEMPENVKNIDYIIFGGREDF